MHGEVDGMRACRHAGRTTGTDAAIIVHSSPPPVRSAN
jgi:hypothetical protein